MSICLTISDVDWAITKDVFSIVGTVVSAIGVFLVFCIGLAGLVTWRRQLKGTADHDLARRVLVDLYGYRECIKYVRSAHNWVKDTTLPENEVDGLSSSQIGYRGNLQAYGRRLESIKTKRVILGPALLESEAVWGTELKKLFESLYAFEFELETYVVMYLATLNPDEDRHMVDAYRSAISSRRDVLRYIESNEPDIFNDEFDSAIRLIEVFLKAKLIR
ncbi:hypothetical protein [Pseudomonas fluorescens]|uniref:hypothetical protein n=1 Tax=Pseudomonas fluorescens TaxID=294 RepID=UPI0016552C08|nr:hypothetical protein [Pseudomonas fluorescens]MBC8783640.1 hypothetical protein [Pseudomonas fluorescens]